MSLLILPVRFALLFKPWLRLSVGPRWARVVGIQPDTWLMKKFKRREWTEEGFNAWRKKKLEEFRERENVAVNRDRSDRGTVSVVERVRWDVR